MTMTQQLRELDALVDDLTVDAYDDEEQLVGFLVGADEALQGPERAWLAGIEVEVVAVDTGPDARTGLTARIQRKRPGVRGGAADLTFGARSQLGLIVAAYRRWQGRTP